MDFNFELHDSTFFPGDFIFEDIQDKFYSTDRSVEKVQLYGAEDQWGYGYYPDENFEEGFIFSKSQIQEQQQLQQEQQSFSVYDLFDEIPQYESVFQSFEKCLEVEDFTNEVSETVTVISEVGAKKEKEYPIPLAALELLNNHGNGFKRLKGERIIEPNNGITTVNDNNQVAASAADHRILSTEGILRFAGERFIQSYSKQQVASHPFNWSFSGLNFEQTKDVELVELLLASAEKVGCQQYESACRLLHFCDDLASNAGNPVRRAAYYFCEALREKIDKESGRNTSKGLGKMLESFDIDKAMMVPDGPKLAFHQGLPLSQVEKFAGIQAIIEKVSESNKVHVIDLRIANGVQWIALMQALASRHEHFPIESLKITVIATTARDVMEETGKWLTNFANTLKIPFSFNIVMVSNMFELKQDLFKLDNNETIAVYSSFALRRMIAQSTELESLMRVIKSLNPCVMVVTEVEANHNSPAFVNRFIEALFFYGTLFDCLESFMKRNEPNRMAVEATYCFQAIRNIVATEGEERQIRNVKIDVWRAFFARFGMEELELSPSSIYQANLIVDRFPAGTSCTLGMNGKCLIMGWKDLLSLETCLEDIAGLVKSQLWFQMLNPRRKSVQFL
ncbi:DELLA protein RGL1-like [Humulus lupulus]|uniref:DELLA protein RGL1-like n=1 Tax=Humulus lupulus TaxID=3486 RepID=UPI002B40F061|nr:DELLA protein RGL1-like [Humulus lupulus]